MDIQPIVIGTAGHIDHGKSTLVRALTGVDPDRLKEEQERGLTIDLGFAPLALPDGRVVGLVDVPGHERFIRNMVAGASGIDLVVLVVAADDGVMPQTREHLQIMELLGIDRGLIALTKVDAVDPELAELAAEDVRDLVAGTFLEGAPLFPLSGITGIGLEEFKAALVDAAVEAEPRSSDGVFRMPIQRVFSKRGFGTVVTGIPISGRVRPGDVLEVVPARARGKVRGLHAYGQATDEGCAGHSTAINISDLDVADAQRGGVVATPDFFHPLRMVGARVTALPGLDRSIENRMSIRLHVGTADAPGEIVVLDRESIEPGESGLVQLRLHEPVVCAPGDRFVLRLLSPVLTLGGGVVLEESRHRLKRFKDFVLRELEHQATSLASPTELLESILARRGADLVPEREAAVAIKRTVAEARELLEALAAEERVIQLGKGDRWMHVDGLERALGDLGRAVDAWFGEHAHRRTVDVRELRSATGFEPALMQAVLDEAQKRGRLTVESGGQVCPSGREIAVSDDLRALCATISQRLEQAAFQPPPLSDLIAETKADEPTLRKALDVLEDEHRVLRVQAELYFDVGALERARASVVANCERNGHLEIPELRDELGTSRKFLIPILEHFDATGVTARQGANRILRRH